jgi:hypothetical protein
MAPSLHNMTPFAGLAFESWGKGEEVWYTVVLRGTFALGRGGAPVRGLPQQEPLVMASAYWGEDPLKTSMRRDNDLAPFKPAADVHVVGTARSPGGRALPRWAVSAKVGDVSKMVHVTGPRQWRRLVVGMWTLSDPTPVKEVPVRYELAYGGEVPHRDPSKHLVCERNPVGRGLVGSVVVGTDIVEAPQVESPAAPISKLGRDATPEGFGPLSPVWMQRRVKAGTYDQKWLDKVWPRIPADFDFAFYNSAHPDLVAKGYLRGDEPIELVGWHHDGPVHSRLPGIRPFLLLRCMNGSLVPTGMKLDTVVIDTDEDRVYLTWRGRVPVEVAPRVIEARALLPKELIRG